MKHKDNHYTFDPNHYIDPQYLLPDTDDLQEKRRQLEAIGFVEKESRRRGEPVRYFYGNTFANYLTQCLTGVQDDSGNLYIYNRQGYYQMGDEALMGKLVKHLMCQYDQLWSKHNETAALDSYHRSITRIVKAFNQTEHINLLNGVLDLETLQLLPHSPEFYSTIQIPLEYDPAATCPRFDQFLLEISCEDKELVGLLQEMTGYFLCHHTKAEKAFLFYGSGCNGKSVMAKLVTHLVGQDNVSGVPLSKFGETFALASLVNKNLNIAAENELATKFNSENFKAIVSGDSMNIQRKYKEDLHCALSCKLLFLVNTLPDTADVTHGFFRKLLIIPFNRTFTPVERDENLLEKLVLELPGILNWAIQGLKRLQESRYRFSPCVVVDTAMDEYKKHQNPVGDFFLEHYTPSKNSVVKKSEIYDKYCFWSHQNGDSPVNRQQFWKMLKAAAEETNSGIALEYKRVRGIDHLIGYTYRAEHKPQDLLEINF